MPPWRFLYLRETKSWWCEGGEEGGGGEKVHLLTHATARGVGKKQYLIFGSAQKIIFFIITIYFGVF